jgi:RNA polymerase sigma-70 factor (ECF subfamily)
VAEARLSDEQLLERFVRGDVASLGLLAERCEASLVGLARSLLWGREDLARDAVQDAWVKVIRHAKGFRRGSGFRTWMYRIVINACHDVRQRHARAGAAGAWADAAEHGPRAGDEQADGGPAWARNGTLRGAVDELPDGQRLILMLGYHRDLTHTQIAEILDVPVGTVKSRLHAALTALRRRLGESGDGREAGGEVSS